MVQLQIISGKRVGLLWEARSFPARVGRGPSVDLQLDEAGIWEQHFDLNLDVKTGFSVMAHPGAILSINQTPVASARLRNGDIITAGAAQISFRLSPTRQRSQRLREWLVWGLLATVTAGQVGLIAWLLR
jgi:hypothetical protein